MGKVQNKSIYSKYWNTKQALHKTDAKTKTFSTFLPFKGCTTSGSTGLVMEWNSACSSKQDHPCCYACSSFHIKYQYDLRSVKKKKNPYIHFEKEHTSQSSQKHANYSASLQSPFALISCTGKRSCMVCGPLMRKSDEILSFCRGRIKIRETTSIYYWWKK